VPYFASFTTLPTLTRDFVFAVSLLKEKPDLLLSAAILHEKIFRVHDSGLTTTRECWSVHMRVWAFCKHFVVWLNLKRRAQNLDTIAIYDRS
jgi:hypothetical protein